MERKEFARFSRRKSSKDGYRNICKDCHNTYVREKWYVNNAERHKASVAAYKKNNKHKVIAISHGLDSKEVKNLLESTNCCEICKTTEDLCVDHCHSTMTVRGRLCRRCNVAIGMLGDAPELVLERIKQIEEYFNGK